MNLLHDFVWFKYKGIIWKRLNVAFVQWSNASQFLGIKNKEVKSAVKFVIVNIKRHLKKKLTKAFIRWVDRTRDEADFQVRHAEATRFIINAIRKHVQGKLAKAFRCWDRFRLTQILEEQRQASNNAALELQRQNHENMVAARFIAMIVSKEKAAYKARGRNGRNCAMLPVSLRLKRN